MNFNSHTHTHIRYLPHIPLRCCKLWGYITTARWYIHSKCPKWKFDNSSCFYSSSTSCTQHITLSCTVRHASTFGWHGQNFLTFRPINREHFCYCCIFYTQWINERNAIQCAAASHKSILEKQKKQITHVKSFQWSKIDKYSHRECKWMSQGDSIVNEIGY